MNDVRITQSVQQPCFGLLRRNEVLEQVKVMQMIYEAGMTRNTVVCPDGTELTVSNGELVWDTRRKGFVRHPDYPKALEEA
jgi:hypothetical protein